MVDGENRSEEVRCVVIDSVQSQANRFEEALLDAYDEDKLSFPLLYVNFDTLPDVGRITSLDAPHRIADAIFRESLQDGTPFRETDEGRAFAAATVRNATALFELCPTALIFGVWDSTGSEGGLGNKFARTLVSEIVGFRVTQGVRTASRIDPTGVEKCNCARLMTANWTCSLTSRSVYR
jgi:CRISPR-associated protein Csb1